MRSFILPTGQTCPCGSGQAYIACCGPLHARASTASSAEHLMRSRYSAYVLEDWDYLLYSWHSRTRPSWQSLQRGGHPDWTGLEILAVSMGTDSDEAFVEFRARYRDGDRLANLWETSRFLREDGQWRYLDGQLHPSAESAQPGRNDPCPCGSGRKFKRCCGKR